MEKKVRLVAIASIAAIILACGLLAIPYFIVPNEYASLGSISGYQFFFKAVGEVYEKNSHIGHVSGLGIASIVLMALALISYVFAFKSSAFSMLGGLLNVATSILFFAMEASKKNVYGSFYSFVRVSFISYIIGALLLISGFASIIISFISMKVEKKDLSSKKSYSYLKK